MNRLTRSLSSEWRKVRSTKLWWILAIVLGAYSAMMAAMFAFIFGAMSDEMGGIALPAQDTANMVYASVSTFGYVIPLLLGALMATGELRHRTLALTFTLEPQRGIVLLIAGLLGAIGAGAPVLAATDGDPMLDSGETWLLALRVLAALGLWSIIGFGIGVLVRNQAFAIVLALVFTQFVEPVLRTGAQFWEWSAQVAKFLPGSATDAFVGASVMTSMSSLDPSLPEGSGALGIWGGLLVMLAYAVIAVAAGWALRWRRDVV
jgi:hypothetical protein